MVMQTCGGSPHCGSLISSLFFFFNDTATTEIYTLSLHDALPISARHGLALLDQLERAAHAPEGQVEARSEEHTSELQSQSNLVCRLLLEKKKISRSRRPRHAMPRRSSS